MNFTLAILYAPAGRRPLSIASINDRQLLEIVAERAILEAEATATELLKGDPTLGVLQHEEANKLRRVLCHFLAKGAELGTPNASNGEQGMTREQWPRCEVFTSDHVTVREGTHIVYPPSPVADGKFALSEVLDWAFLMVGSMSG